MRFGNTGGYYGGQIGGGITPMVKNLLLINIGIYLVASLLRLDMAFTYNMGLVPYRFWHGHIYLVVTYMFLHGGLSHILMNMFMLWMFGTALETVWGSRKFLQYYMITGIGAGLLNAMVTPMSQIPVVGASGAIYGLLLAFGLTFPNQQIYIYFLFPIRAKYLVMIMGAFELFVGLTSSNSGIAHFAHLGGMLFGIILLKKDDWFRAFKVSSQKRRDMKNLKIIYNKEEEKEKLQNEIDEILDKINEHGIDSLSPKDRQRLKEASEKLRNLEKQ